MREDRPINGDAASKPLRVLIVGGGVAGLAAAYDLARQEYAGRAVDVTVAEAGAELGGLASGFKGKPSWEWPLERFYHHLFTNDDAIIALTRELGMADRLTTHAPVTALYHKGGLYPLDSPLRVLRFPHLSLWNRLRMGLVLAYLRYDPRRPWRRYDRIVADEWLGRWMGSAAYSTVWQPMLQGKFGAHYGEVNLAWFWARIYKRTQRLAYYEGGFQAFVDALAQAAAQRGAALHIGVRVERIMPLPGGGYQATTNGPGGGDYDAVLSTVSPGLMQKLAPDLPESYLGQLRKLRSMGAVALIVALKRSLLDKVYWANIPKQEGLPFLALVEHTNMIDPAHYGGDRLIYIGDYLDPDHRYFGMDAEQLLAEVAPYLSRFNAGFEPDWITGAWLHKASYAQPVPPVGYASMIPDVRTPLPGLYFASMSQVYPWDRGTNYAVEMGRRVAQMAMDDARNGAAAAPSD